LASDKTWQVPKTSAILMCQWHVSGARSQRWNYWCMHQSAVGYV